MTLPKTAGQPRKAAPDDFSDKARRRLGRIMRNAFVCAGIGVGLIIVKYCFPGLMAPKKADLVFDGTGYSLIFYGLTIIATFVGARKWIFKVHLLMFWIILPGLLMKVAMAAM